MSIWEELAHAVGATLCGAEAPHDTQRAQQDDALPFTVGMIVLGAKMAKADGVVTRDEVRAFKKAFKVSDAEMKNAARVFKRAKQDPSGFETTAEELVTVFKGDRRMLEYILEGLFHIAKADQMLLPAEEKFLRQVAKHLGFTDAEFALTRARHTPMQDRNPYDVLGVNQSVSDEEIKSQYRRLLAQSQPDEFLARGLPKEFMLIATEKLAAIKEAYETITKLRHRN